MAEEQVDKGRTRLNVYIFKTDIAAIETVCRRMRFTSHIILRRGEACRTLLRAIARGQVAVVRVGDDKELERTIRAIRYVRKTLGTIEPKLAGPLYQIHLGLTLCRKLRRSYANRRKE
ncbi:MAG: hypothetical protein ACTSPX_01840 [Candidatus Thorarchaeota archaeon]